MKVLTISGTKVAFLNFISSVSSMQKVGKLELGQPATFVNHGSQLCEIQSEASSDYLGFFGGPCWQAAGEGRQPQSESNPEVSSASCSRKPGSGSGSHCRAAAVTNSTECSSSHALLPLLYAARCPCQHYPGGNTAGKLDSGQFQVRQRVAWSSLSFFPPISLPCLGLGFLPSPGSLQAAN